MSGLVKTLKNIWSITELKDKLILTFSLVIVYRLGSFISLPSIDLVSVGNILEAYQKNGGSNQAAGLLGLLSSFTGGALSRASILALGIMPYISASIIVQLMGLAIPYIKKLQSDGESGRKTINQITRWLTIAICLFQSVFYLTQLTTTLLPIDQFASAYSVNPVENPLLFYIPSVIILTAGTVFSMWLGEKITDKGIGNGISILIMVGILADLPSAFVTELGLQSSSVLFLFEIIFWLVVIVLSIILVSAVRKVPVQYVRRAQPGVSAKSLGVSVRDYIPLKVNAAGVMPIIFAQALMFVPGLLGRFTQEGSETRAFFDGFANMFSWQYNLLFALLIIVFTFLYTAITIPVNQMADDLKKNGGLVPKVKPGSETEEYLDGILSKITFPGAIFLALIAILPALVKIVGLTETDKFALFFGGTSLLIMVGVFLDTVQQINTYLLNHHYDGLMESKLSRNPVRS
ncbi:MAG: preprotein translocase subunit SecY [Flavobacteriales bacterium]|nr:preprotein translocase subunit SecY [Flavobacteriales bacterium]